MSSQHVTQNTLSIDVATSHNPATDELIATYAFQTADEVEGMLAGNNAAFRLWRATPISKRVEAYRRLSAILRERSVNLAGIITAEMGKTLAAARAEVEKCAATIDWIATNGPAILASFEAKKKSKISLYFRLLSSWRRFTHGWPLNPTT